MSIGQKIRVLREEASLTQQELADKLFISRQTVSNWERDHIKPTITNLQELEDLFDVEYIDWDEEIKAEQKADNAPTPFYKLLLIILFICLNITLFLWLSKNDLYRVFGGYYYYYSIAFNLLSTLTIVVFTSFISLIIIRLILKTINKYNL